MAKVAKKAAAPPKAAQALKKQQKAQVAAAAKKPVKKVRSRHDMLLRVSCPVVLGALPTLHCRMDYHAAYGGNSSWAHLCSLCMDGH